MSSNVSSTQLTKLQPATKPMDSDREDFLPYARHEVLDEDIEAVRVALRSGFLTCGPAVEEFEAALCSSLDAPHAVACASGTAALHLATMALELGPGDCAIVPSITFMATANAVRYTGADVVFADVDPDNGLLTAQTLHAALARCHGRARAVLPVHLNGQSAEMADITDLAQEHGLFVIEDSCHAIGGIQRLADGTDRAIGGCFASHAATFSFHPAKTVAAGEGGAVTTRDPALADRMRRLRNHGIERAPDKMRNSDLALAADGTPNPWYHELQDLGFNYRMPDILCALGTSQLARLPTLVDRRASLTAAYDAALAPLSDWLRPIGRLAVGRPAWHLYPVLIDFARLGLDRATVMERLRARGIGTQVHYIPVHRQPFYASGNVPELPGADSYYRRVLSLPLHTTMQDTDVASVAQALTDLADA